MKHLLTFVIVFHALLFWPSCQAAEVTRHKADVCVYGGTTGGGVSMTGVHGILWKKYGSFLEIEEK